MILEVHPIISIINVFPSTSLYWHILRHFQPRIHLGSQASAWPPGGPRPSLRHRQKQWPRGLTDQSVLGRSLKWQISVFFGGWVSCLQILPCALFGSFWFVSYYISIYISQSAVFFPNFPRLQKWRLPNVHYKRRDGHVWICLINASLQK